MSDIIPLPLQELACIIEKARVLDMLANAGGLDASTVVDGEELAALLSGLSDDELTNVLALVWVGRGTFDRDSWQDAIYRAEEMKNKRIVRYLVDSPMLGFFLEEGLAELGVTVPLPQEEPAR
ncbi:MAG: DUF3775 domain-containing protein [Alphaproteobacteria bacterium]|nr:DUF3775 domain-containing protein [Alphaproteobacteria bacterium]